MEVTGTNLRDEDDGKAPASGLAAGSGAAEDAPTDQLVAGAVGDRCATCGAPMASDQRYCVQCGDRRGKARFTVASLLGQTDATGAGSKGAAPHPRRRPPSAAALIAGIATLLLAMGVGVEIGRLGKNNTSTERASGPSVQVVTLGGSGGGGAAVANASTPNTNTAAPAAATTSATNTNASNTKTNAAFAPTATIAKKVQVEAQSTAQKVLGSSSVKLAPATVTVGGSCSSDQAGCQNGRFTGKFFSP